MELDRRQRQRRKGRKAAEDARSIHDVSDDMIWRILLRLDSPIWLLWAACACKRWRRVITSGGADDDQGRAFLRLASSLHPPTVVGQYHNYSTHCTVDIDNQFVPSSSPAAAPIDGCRFALGHLRFRNSSWHVNDCYGGLVLLRRLFRISFPPSPVPSLIVYDPLTHQHRKIYSPPPPHRQLDGADIRDAFLLDGADGNISISNFRVFYRCFKGPDADPDACVFSTAKGGDWHFLDEDQYTYCCWNVAGHVDRSLYMGMFTGFVAALDNTSLVFSKVALPIRLNMLKNHQRSTFTVVHGAGLGPALPPRTSIIHVRGEELELFRRVHGSGEWMLEHVIPNLSETTATRDLLVSLEKDTYMARLWIIMKKNGIAWSTMASGVNADGAPLVVLSACQRLRRSDIYHDSDSCSRWFFSMDVNTMELQVFPEVPYCGKTTMELQVFPEVPYCAKTRSISTYTLPWPQFLRACVSTSSPTSSSQQDGRVDQAGQDHQSATGPRRGARDRKPSGRVHGPEWA